MKKLIYLILLFFYSCGVYHTQKPNKDFIEMINNNCGISDTTIRYSGIYHLVSYNGSSNLDSIFSYYKDRPGIFNPTCFFKNGYIFYGKAAYGGIYKIKEEIVKKVFEDKNKETIRKCWGKYEINDSKIKAVIYVGFTGISGMDWRYWHICNFEGKIESNGNIYDWHMVPPYPKLSKVEKIHEDNFRYIEFDKTADSSSKCNKSIQRCKKDFRRSLKV